MKRAAIPAVALLALACAGSLQAHHSDSMYEQTPLWVKGTVVRFENVDPHTITTLEERSENGQVCRWAVEGPGQFQLDIGAKVPKVGDAIEFCAFPYKSAADLSRIFPGVDFSWRSSPEADGRVWGHLMATPDGEKRLWNPHGVIGECIRSSDDQRQSWLDLLNTNSSIRQAWCQQRNSARVQSTALLRAFVEEVDRLIDTPCG
jgi:hypothetical protein